MIPKYFRRIYKYFVSLGLMVYAFTFGLLTRKGQGVHSLICKYFGVVYPRPHLPERPPSSIIGDAVVSLCEVEVRAGNMSVAELAVIAGMVKRYQPKTIFEIGTMNGRTTLNMALNAPDDCRVYTLDLPADAIGKTRYPISERFLQLVDKPRTGELFADKSPETFPCVSRITQLFGDSAMFDYTPYYNRMDFVFIDGSHDYDYVLNDSEVALKLLRNGRGVIVWHDYREEMAVVPALDEFLRRYPQLQIFHIAQTSFAFAEISGTEALK